MLAKDALDLSMISNIQLVKFQGTLRAQPLQVLLNAFSAQAVDDHYVLATSQVPAGGIGPNKPCSPSNDRLHWLPLNRISRPVDRISRPVDLETSVTSLTDCACGL